MAELKQEAHPHYGHRQAVAFANPHLKRIDQRTMDVMAGPHGQKNARNQRCGLASDKKEEREGEDGRRTP